MINIGPSHEFHGGQCLLFLGWYFTSTLEGRNINLKNCSLGYETCRPRWRDGAVYGTGPHLYPGTGYRHTDQYRTAALRLSRCGRGISGTGTTDQRPGAPGC